MMEAGAGGWLVRVKSAGVATRPGTHAVHLLDYYHRKYELHSEDLPGCTLADRLSLALPLYPQMTEAEQEYVIERLAAWKPAARKAA